MKFQKIFRALFTGLFLILALALLSSCGKKERQKLVMGTESTFPPYEYYSAGKITGIDPDIMQLAADKMNMDLVIEDISFDYILSALQSGRIDVAASGLTITPERQKLVDFSIPYAMAGLKIILPVRSKITGVKELKGKIIGVQRSSTSDEYVTKNIQTPSRFPNVELAVQNLLEGKIDAVVADSMPAESYVKEHKELKLLRTPLTEEKYGIAVRKGETKLLAKINETILELQKKDLLHKLHEKHQQLYAQLKEKKDTEKQVIGVASDPTFPPFGYIRNGKIEGIEADLLNMIGRELNLTLRFEQVGFDSLFEAVANDNGVSIGAGSISISKERQKIVNFTTPFFSMKQFCFVRSDSKAKDINDLKGKKIGAIYYTTAEKYIREHRLGIPVCYSEGELLVKALSKGEIDAIVLDELPASMFMKRYRNIRKLPRVLLEEQYAFAVRKENTELLNRINEIMLRSISDGTVQKIIDHQIRIFQK